MLKKFRLHNFRTFLNAEFSFTPLHLIVGKNNSGKSNLFHAMRFLHATASADLATASSITIPGAASEMKNWSSKSTVVELSCQCELDFEGTPHDYEYSLKLAIEEPGAIGIGPSTMRIQSEQLRVSSAGFGEAFLLENDGREAQMLHEGSFERSKRLDWVKTLAPRESTMLNKLYELETNRRAIYFRRFLSSWCFFNLSPQQMRFGWSEAKADDVALRVDAANLANVLYRLKNIDERRYRSVIDDVRRIEPDLKAINFVPSPGQAPVPFVELATRERASWVGLSDGTLRSLALTFFAHCAGAWRVPDGGLPTPLVFVEEPENGVYPGYLRSVFELFEKREQSAQFIFTSHSPYFINLFDGRRDAVALLRRKQDRTEVVEIGEPDDDDPERLLLAEQYSMEMLD